MFWKRGFWFIFASFATFHLVEDLFWAFIARFTSVPIGVIIAGILSWALLTTVFVHTKPFKKYWNRQGVHDDK